MSKTRPEEIYNFLNQEYPDLFPPLQKLPKELKHPGDEPRRPHQFDHHSAEFKVSEPISNIASWLESINYRSYATEDVNIGVLKKVIDTIQHNGDIDYWEENVYGEPETVRISLRVEKENYRSLVREHEQKKKSWKEQIERRRARKESIATVKSANQRQIKRARDQYRDLWVAAGRHLKGEKSPTFIQKKISHLEQQLERYRSLLPIEGE